jgi:hypothetical protein
MIFGSQEQNKKLKDSASKSINTTPRARTSNKLSAKIASNQTSDNTNSIKNQRTVESSPRSSLNDGNPDPVRGSFEGLDNSPSTYIQPNNVGYASKEFQTARYKEKTKFNGLDINKNNFTGLKRSGKIQRYGSSVAQNSSAHKLNSKLTVEKMFR